MPQTKIKSILQLGLSAEQLQVLSKKAIDFQGINYRSKFYELEHNFNEILQLKRKGKVATPALKSDRKKLIAWFESKGYYFEDFKNGTYFLGHYPVQEPRPEVRKTLSALQIVPPVAAVPADADKYLPLDCQSPLDAGPLSTEMEFDFEYTVLKENPIARDYLFEAQPIAPTYIPSWARGAAKPLLFLEDSNTYRSRNTFGS